MVKFLEFIGVICVIMGFGSQLVECGSVNHRYKAGDPVPLYVNKVGPYQNPSETYNYFDLPFCQPDSFKEKKQTLSELLSGDHLIKAPYELEFLVDKNFEVACSKNLTKEEVSRFRKAIKRDNYFQMYYDDLPVQEFVGKIDRGYSANVEEYKYLLYTHIGFEVLFNKDCVIEINVRFFPEIVVDLTEDKETCVEFVYTVLWKEVDIAFEKRMEKYSVASSLPRNMEIGWFAIINSCVTVVFLIGFLLKFYICRLKKDFSEGLHYEELATIQEDKGWKYMKEDVFTFPVHKSLLAAALGSGTQLFTFTILILILGVFGTFYPYNRVHLLTALIIVYTITSSIAGYTATSIYCHLDGTNWSRNLLLTGCLFTGPLLFTFCLLNSIATAYKASVALPFGTLVEFVLIWTLFTLPLLLLGGFFGKSSKVECQDTCRNSKAEFQAPFKGPKITREIPPLPWYRHALPQMALAGILPFSAMNVELYSVILSLWGHQIYIFYKFLLVTFILLLIIIALVNGGLTCYQLVSEDHKWWWRSFLCGGSVGLYVYGYCIFFYYARSDWSGSLQVSFFFGYMACICYGLFLMFGTVGFMASFLFVRHMYHSIKCD